MQTSHGEGAGEGDETSPMLWAPTSLSPREVFFFLLLLLLPSTQFNSLTNLPFLVASDRAHEGIVAGADAAADHYVRPLDDLPGCFELRRFQHRVRAPGRGLGGGGSATFSGLGPRGAPGRRWPLPRF